MSRFTALTSLQERRSEGRVRSPRDGHSANMIIVERVEWKPMTTTLHNIVLTQYVSFQKTLNFGIRGSRNCMYIPRGATDWNYRKRFKNSFTFQY